MMFHATSQDPSQDDANPRLHRVVGVFGATMMGLGSIIGTGVFVSIVVAAQSAGPGNQLLSDGTYDYQYDRSPYDLG